jgi:excisionase family DNA binding protein
VQILANRPLFAVTFTILPQILHRFSVVLSPKEIEATVDASLNVITAMVANEILTVPEVATEMRCSRAHVYNAIRGKIPGMSPLPAISMGRRRLIRRSSLEEWKRENERSAADDKIEPSQKIQAVNA